MVLEKIQEGRGGGGVVERRECPVKSRSKKTKRA